MKTLLDRFYKLHSPNNDGSYLLIDKETEKAYQYDGMPFVCASCKGQVYYSFRSSQLYCPGKLLE